MPTSKRNSQTPSRQRPSRQRSHVEEQKENEKNTKSRHAFSRGIQEQEETEPQQKNSQQSRVSVAAVFASQKALVSQYLESIVVDDGSDVGGATSDARRRSSDNEYNPKDDELATERERRALKRQRSENKQKEKLARGAEDRPIDDDEDIMASTTRGLPAKERVREACRTLSTTVKQRLADVSSDHRASMEALEDKVVTEDFLVLKQMADDFSEGVGLWIQQAKDVVKSLRNEQLRLKGYLEATQRSLGDRRRRFEEENALRSAQLEADIVAMLAATEEALSDVLPPESRRASMSMSRRENNNETAVEQQSDRSGLNGGRAHRSAQLPTTGRSNTNGADDSMNAIDSRREEDRQKILGSGAKIQDLQAVGGQRGGGVGHFHMVASTPMHPSSYIQNDAAHLQTSLGDTPALPSIATYSMHHQHDGAPPPPSVLHTAPRSYVPSDARRRRGGSHTTHNDEQRGETSDRTPSTAPPPTATTASASSSSYSLQRPPVSSSSFSSSVASRGGDVRTNTNYNNIATGNESGAYSYQSSAHANDSTRIVSSAAVRGRRGDEEETMGGAVTATFGTTRSLNKSLSMVAARSASRLFPPQNQHQTSDVVGTSKERHGESHHIANGDDDENSNPIVTLNSLSVGNTFNRNAHNRHSTISPSVRQPNTSQSQQRDAFKVIREVNAPPHASHSHGRRTVEDEKYKNDNRSVVGGKTQPNRDVDSDDDDEDVLLQDGTYREDHISGSSRTRFHNANAKSKRASVAATGAATTGANPFFSRAASSASAPSNSSFRRVADGAGGGAPRSMTSASSLTAGIIDGGKKDSHARPHHEGTRGGGEEKNRATSASMLATSSSFSSDAQITMGRGHFRGATNAVARPLLSKFNDDD